MEVSRTGALVRISVSDNGKGLGERNESESARFGLMGMRERVQALNGEFHLESRPGEGLRVTALIPIPGMALDPGAAGGGTRAADVKVTVR